MKHAWIFALLAMALAMSGCETVTVGSRPAAHVEYVKIKKNRPPPWAPAHGYRNKMRYRYYPAQQVYFNIDRGQYVWLEHGVWRVGVRLPGYIRLGDSVNVEIEGNHPNLYHRQIVNVYPPRSKYKLERRPDKHKPEYRQEQRRGDDRKSDGRDDRKSGKDDKPGKGRGNSRR